MSLGSQSQISGGIFTPIAILAKPKIITDILVNPPDIVLIKDDGFIINQNNMETMQPYRMNFLDSRYVIWKNEKGALVIEEV